MTLKVVQNGVLGQIPLSDFHKSRNERYLEDVLFHKSKTSGIILSEWENYLLEILLWTVLWMRTAQN